MKKILFVINSLSSFGGCERVATMLANKFQKNGVSVKFVLATNENQIAYEVDSSISVEAGKGGGLSLMCRVIKSSIDWEPDLILVHSMGKLGLLMSVLPKSLVSKMYVLEHCAFAALPKWMRLSKKILYRRLAGIVCLTNKDKEDYAGLSSRVNVIPNASPFQRGLPRCDLERKRILSIGRLEFEKGFDMLLESWEIASSCLEDWELHIVGAGSQKNMLLNIIGSKNLQRVFIGDPTPNVSELYRNASIYVMSSRHEGLPMVLIEAQSFGMPIVSFDCPNGPSEIIENNIDGYLVKCFDIQGLSDAIVALAQSLELRFEFSNNAINSSLRYDEDVVYNKWVHVLNE